MRSLVLILSVAVTASVAMDVPREFKDKTDFYNLFSQCFGEEAMALYYGGIMQACKYCMQVQTPSDLANELNNFNSNEVEVLKGLLSNPALAQLIMASSNFRGRNKREIDEGLVKMSQSDLDDLMDGIQESKMEMMSKIGNLTCVLTQMEFLTADGDINMDAFSYETLKEVIGDTKAGSDEEFVQALATGYEDCNEVSRSWPQSTLDRHPLMKAYGRQKIFLKCMFKMEEKMCYKWQMYMGMKFFHGLDTGSVDLGLPGNKYDTAMMAGIIMYERAPKEMQFIDDFFWSRDGM